MIVIKDFDGVSHPIKDYTNYSVRHTSSGNDQMRFYIEVNHPDYQYVKEEYVVEDDYNRWLIKKIDDDCIDCELDFDFLKREVHAAYESRTRLLSEVLQDRLPDFAILGANVSTIRRTITFDYCTDYDIIQQCMNTYKVYFSWNLLEKEIYVYSNNHLQSSGEYLSTELNLKEISFKGDASKFCTRLYAYGADGMSIADAMVDGQRYGLPYVENGAYKDEVVCAYWTDDRYTDPDSMYNDALEKLSELSFPVRSYECKIVDLARQNPKYSFLDFRVHKIITLIDIERDIRLEHHIVEYKEYPDEPDRNVVTISAVPPTVKTSMSGISDKIAQEVSAQESRHDKKVRMATAMILSAFGSHLIESNGELFMCDTDSLDTAQVVWRWNFKGFAKSTSGVEGPYTTALTYDDTFITSVVDALIVRADTIQTGVLQDEYGRFYLNLDTGDCNLDYDGVTFDGHTLKYYNDLMNTQISANEQEIKLGAYRTGQTNMIVNGDFKDPIASPWVAHSNVRKSSFQGLTAAILRNTTNSGDDGCYIKQNVKSKTNQTIKISFKAMVPEESTNNAAVYFGVKNATRCMLTFTPTKRNEWEVVTWQTTTDLSNFDDGFECFIQNRNADSTVYIADLMFCVDGYSYASAVFDIQADEISSRVTSGEVESIISQRADLIRMKAAKIVWTSDNSSMTEDGEFTMKKGSIKLGYDSTTKAYNFSVNNNGELKCTGADITGSIRTVYGSLETLLDDGWIYFKYGSSKLGKIGSAFVEDKKAFNLNMMSGAQMFGIYSGDGDSASPLMTYQKSEGYWWFKGGASGDFGPFEIPVSIDGNGAVSSWSPNRKLTFKHGLCIAMQ